MRNFKKLSRLLLIAFTALFIFVLAGCGNQSSKEQTVKVGISASDEPIWKVVKQNAKKDNINIKIVTFNDYNQPNTALAQGELDINAYQHKYFLDAWNKAHHTDLVSIGVTIIQPMALYSNKVTSLRDLKDGAKVSLPNDTTNESRALELLQSAGLITLKKGVKLASVKDVTSNKLNLKLTLLDANQTARSLGDVDASVVNANVASDAKLNPKKAIYREKVNKASKPWINLIATQKKDKDNKTYKKVVQDFHKKNVEKAINKVYGGNAVPAWKVDLK